MIEDWGLEDTDYFRFVGNDGPQYLTLGSPQVGHGHVFFKCRLPAHKRGLDLDLGGGSDVVDFIPRMQIIGLIGVLEMIL